MYMTGRRKCLLALSLLFIVCMFYMKSDISRTRMDFYRKSDHSSSSDDNASLSSYHSTCSSVKHVIRGSAAKVTVKDAVKVTAKDNAKVTVKDAAKVNVKVTADDLCVRDFLSDYSKHCENHLTKPHYHLRPGIASLLCPCIPSQLVGHVPVNETVAESLDQLEADLSTLTEVGRWRPSQCVARQRLAIVIPYADRERHLRIFLRHMHPLLQRQLIDYSIFVIEQMKPDLFNRAMLMNVGYVVANATDESFDCFIFHDVDQLPIDDRNFYTCSKYPRHVVGYRKKFKYNFAYATSFAGGNSFTRQQFESINGFSNSFYGWGGEDDDLYQRTEAKKLKRSRYPRCIAKYDELTHRRDRRNPIGVNQRLGFIFRPEVYEKDGLNSLNYTVVSTERRKLFTKLSVSLPDPPPPPKTKFLDPPSKSKAPDSHPKSKAPGPPPKRKPRRRWGKKKTS